MVDKLWMTNSDPLSTFPELYIVVHKGEKYQQDAHFFSLIYST